MQKRASQAKNRLIIFSAIGILAVSLGYLLSNGELSILQRLLRPGFVLGGAAFFVMLVVWLNYYEYHGIGPQDGITRRGPNKKVACITFDDGPSSAYTPQILDVLKEKQVKATFFVVGRSVEKYPEVARRIVAEGHDLGNHTYSHRDLVPASEAVVLEQLEKADAAIKNVTGLTARLFRPPRGLFNNSVRKLLVARGYRIILWSTSSADWSGLGPKTMLALIKLRLRSGGIILFHDSGGLVRTEGGPRQNTVQALPLVIDYLRKQGFEIIPVSEMLADLEEDEAVGESQDSEEALEASK